MRRQRWSDAWRDPEQASGTDVSLPAFNNCVLLAVPSGMTLGVDVVLSRQQSGLFSQLHSSRKFVWLHFPHWERSRALLWASFLITLSPLCSFRCPSVLSVERHCSVLPKLLRNLEPVLKGSWTHEKGGKNPQLQASPQKSWLLCFTGISVYFPYPHFCSL